MEAESSYRTVLRDGTYDGIWTGFTVKIQFPENANRVLEFTVNQGLHSRDIPCNISVENGIAKVNIK